MTIKSDCCSLPTTDVGQKQEMTASKANDTGVALAAVLSEVGGIFTVKAGWNIVTPSSQ